MYSVTAIALWASLCLGLGKAGKIEGSAVVYMHDYVTQFRTTRCGKQDMIALLPMHVASYLSPKICGLSPFP